MQEAKDIYSLMLNLNKVCESTSSTSFNKQIFSVKFKILFLIYNYNQVSPRLLIDSLNMAKSNVALFCKQLLEEGLILTTADNFDHRVIYYSLTKNGQKYVESNLKFLQEHLEGCCSLSGLKNISKNANNILQNLSKMGAKNA